VVPQVVVVQPRQVVVLVVVGPIYLVLGQMERVGSVSQQVDNLEVRLVPQQPDL
jgi:hypothetical protein